jgi:hypothetical protein
MLIIIIMTLIGRGVHLPRVQLNWQRVSSWPAASFQNRYYWDSSVLFWIWCLRANWYCVNWLDEEGIAGQQNVHYLCAAHYKQHMHCIVIIAFRATIYYICDPQYVCRHSDYRTVSPYKKHCLCPLYTTFFKCHLSLLHQIARFSRVTWATIQ